MNRLFYDYFMKETEPGATFKMKKQKDQFAALKNVMFGKAKRKLIKK